LVKRLLNIYENISILWVAIDHETGASVFQKFYGIDGLISMDEARGITPIDPIKKHLLLSLKERYSEYDIEFIEKPCYIKDIQIRYRQFCKKRGPKKFNILLLDNVMRLKDNLASGNQNQIDDRISNTLADIYKENKDYNSFVLFLHHFNNEQMAALNIAEAYRPKANHVKGSGRWMDIPEIVLLLNRPGNYFELIKEYPGHETIMKHLFITEVIKNTFGKTGMNYFWCDLTYSLFSEIPEINKFL